MAVTPKSKSFAPRGGQQTPVCHGIGWLYTELRTAWLEGKLAALRHARRALPVLNRPPADDGGDAP
jgi:hypothetical protein